MFRISTMNSPAITRKIFVSRLVILGTVFFFTILSNACASRQIPEPNVASADVLSAIHQKTNEIPNNMRISTKVDYVDGLHSKRVVGQDLVISSREPGFMRITVSAFDKAVSVLVSDGTSFALIDIGQNVYVTGMATPENISNILPVNLSAADLYRVIRGGFPQDPLAESAAGQAVFQWDASAGGYCRTMKMKNGMEQKVYYSYPELDIFKIAVISGSDTVYEYEASKFDTVHSGSASFRFPGQIMFHLPAQDTDVRLRVEEVKTDMEFSDAVFMLMPPQGAQIRILDAPVLTIPNAAVQQSFSASPDAASYSDDSAQRHESAAEDNRASESPASEAE